MKQDRIYSIKTGMHQFYNQFGIERVMVEGGVGILSSFLNDCVDDTVIQRMGMVGVKEEDTTKWRIVSAQLLYQK